MNTLVTASLSACKAALWILAGLWMLTGAILPVSASPTAQAQASPSSSTPPETNAPKTNISAGLTDKRPALRLTMPAYARDIQAAEIALVRRGFELAGYQLELVNLPTKRGLRSAAGGHVDGVLLRAPEVTSAYNTLITLNPGLLTNHLWVWLNPKLDCPTSRNELSQLKPVSVLGVPYFDRVIALSEVAYVQAHSPAAALKMIQSGRADYGVGSERHLSRFQRASLMKLKRCFDEPLLSVTSHTIMHRKHAEKVDALEVGIRQALAEQSASPAR